MTRKLIVFVVGHESWGKTQTLNALKNLCGSGGRRVTVKDTEFLVRSMSNDDVPESYMDFMASTRRPAIIAALCPKFKNVKYLGNEHRKAIDKTLQLLRTKGYELFFWVMEHQWATSGVITQAEISEMARYGTVRVFSGRNIEAEIRAKNVEKFVADVPLK